MVEPTATRKFEDGCAEHAVPAHNVGFSRKRLSHQTKEFEAAIAGRFAKIDARVQERQAHASAMDLRLTVGF